MPHSDPLAPERAETLAALPDAELESQLEGLIGAGVEAVPLLRRLAEVASASSTRKLARRALHRLRSQGVAIEAPTRGTSQTVLRPVAESREQGLASPIDASGTRVLILLVPVPGGARLYEATVSDAEGVLAVRCREGPRRGARGFMRQLRREGKGLASLAGCELRALVKCASALGVGGEGVDARLLGELVAGAGDTTPGERARSEHAGRIDPERADALLRARLEAGTVAVALVEGERMDALARELDEIDRSPLVLSDLQKRERRGQAIAAAAAELLGSAQRQRLAARLEETAALLADAGDPEGAAAAVSVAARLRESTDALAIEFARRCLDASLERARVRRGREGEGQLILPP